MKYCALILTGYLCIGVVSYGFHQEQEWTSKLESNFHMLHPLRAIALSPDGALLYESNRGSPQTINVRDFKSGQILTKKKIGFDVDFLALSFDGKFLAAASKLLKKISILSYKEASLSGLYQIKLRAYVSEMVFSPNRLTLYVASGKQRLINEGRGETVYIESELISVANLKDTTFELLKELNIGDANRYFKLRLSGDGKRLFYETHRNKFRILDSFTLAEITKVGFERFVDVWVPSYDGKGLFFGFRESWSNDAAVAFQELDKLEIGLVDRMRCFWGFGTLGFLAISPEGKTIFAGKRDRWVAFDVETRARIADKRIAGGTNIANLIASPQKNNLVVIDWKAPSQKVSVSVFSFSKLDQANNLEMCIEPELDN